MSDKGETADRAAAGAAAAGAAGSAQVDPNARPAFDPGTAKDRNRAQPGSLCARLSELQCAGERHCCDTAREFDACKTALMMDCAGTSLDEVAREKVVGFDAMRAEEVLSKLEDMSSRCDPSVKPWFNGPDGLRAMFQGTLAPDQRCMPTSSAIADLGAALASCADSAAHACLLTGVAPPAPPLSATCAARVGSGGSCFVDTNCQEALYCDNPTMLYSGGTCTMRKAMGEPCQHSVECESGFCNHADAVCGAPNVQQAYCN
jgi:hypothetical protein